MLRGKIAFITGSTRGIGWATAELFAQQGATVILHGVSNKSLLNHRVAELKRKYSCRCLGFLYDVRRPAKIKDCFQSIFKNFERLDVLVNNAGILEEGLIGMISQESIQRAFSINAAAVIHHVQGAARLMARRKSGSIINLSSIIGLRGNAGQMVYAGSKAAVIGITKSAAKELAPQGIRVNAVAPGLIATDMTRCLSPQKRTETLKKIALGRAGSAADVANVVLFLASEMSAYVTGEVIAVDGCMLV